MKNNKGITLVALVITIIVLLILAGVSISMVVGENGVLNRATGAADATQVAEIKQELEMAVDSAQGEFINIWSKNTTLNILDCLVDNSATSVGDNQVQLKADGYYITLATDSDNNGTREGTIKKGDKDSTSKAYSFTLTETSSGTSGNGIGLSVTWPDDE